MANLLSKPYEISLWEDRLVTEKDQSNQITSQYYKEEKILVIGSDTMDTPIRAIEPLFTRNINGSSSLTFSLSSHYFDLDLNDYSINPFIARIKNESHLKLRYGTEWFDFIVKNISENSVQKKYTYEAQDMFINELAKTGFDIEFNSELLNNQGKITELAEEVLKGTDWVVGESDIIQEKIEEPLYSIKLEEEITGYSMGDNSPITISANNHIYVFYSCLINATPYFQFLYEPSGNYAAKEGVLDLPNFYVDDVVYEEGENLKLPSFAAIEQPILLNERGKRVVRQQKGFYDPLVKKTVSIYKEKNTNKEVHGFVDYDYSVDAVVQNYITNPSNFIVTSGKISGWRSGLVNYPLKIESNLTDNQNNFEDIKTYIRATSTSLIYNSAIFDNRNKIKELTLGQKFRFQLVFDGGEFTPIISEYEITQNGNYSLDGLNSYVTFSKVTPDPAPRTVMYEGTCVAPLSRTDMVLKKIGFFLVGSAGDLRIEEALLFNELYDSENNLMVPGSVPGAQVDPIYQYYFPSSDIKSINDVEFIYKSKNPSTGFTPIYNDPTFEKVRSIEISESNRFNIIQTLCETFECWAKFVVERDSTGAVLYEDGRLKKSISFHNFIGQENHAGFRYGINLNSIKRDLQSDQIVTKLIVKNNTNQFGKNGYVSIARAFDNEIRENFILNLQYYIQHGMLKWDTVYDDLYSETNGHLNYYGQLRKINIDRDKYIEEFSTLTTLMYSLKAELETTKLLIEETQELLNIEQQTLLNHTGYSYLELTQIPPDLDIEEREKRSKVRKEAAVKDLLISIQSLQNILSTYVPILSNLSARLEEDENRLETLQQLLDEIHDERKLLDTAFYNKYSKFIQEGVWVSQEYVDDNLYYLDATNVLRQSAFPQVKYTIDVLELSQLEGYKNYEFRLGDKTYIEDIEFFGYNYNNNFKTPHQEEVVISAITYYLDNAEKNQISVQNYKTQFEDLFQRIAATTQALKYREGEYARAANAISPTGLFNPDILEDSFNNIPLNFSNVQDESVEWGEQGVKITNSNNPSEALRLTSGGIYISDDGGELWKKAISGQGFNANYMRAGRIDVDVVNIIAGRYPSFSWNSYGLNAYKFNLNQYGEFEFFEYDSFIRLDQYGLYGIKEIESFHPRSTQDVANNAFFSLTWDGFNIRTTHSEEGRLSITSQNDIQIFQKVLLEEPDQFIERELVKLGKLSNNLFGLRLSDLSGKTVLQSGSDGNLDLEGVIKIGPLGYIPRVTLGPTTPKTENGMVVSKIFSVVNPSNNLEDNFQIWDDGTVLAKKLTITSGFIGDTPVEDIPSSIATLSSEALTLTNTVNENTTAISTIEAGMASFTTTVGGTTYIDGGMIRTGTLTADMIKLTDTQSVSDRLSSNASSIATLSSNAIALTNTVNGNSSAISTIEAGVASFTTTVGGTTYIDGGMIRTGTLVAAGVDISGTITATSGTIAGFTIDNYTLTATNSGNYVRISGASGYTPIRVGPSSSDIRFQVSTSGGLTATGVDISGTITATSGNIAGVEISGSRLEVWPSARNGNKGLFYITSSPTASYRMMAYDNVGSGSRMFSLSNEGELYAKNATVSGTITATYGNIGPFSISSAGLTYNGRTQITSSGYLRAAGANVAGTLSGTFAGDVYIENGNYLRIYWGGSWYRVGVYSTFDNYNNPISALRLVSQSTSVPRPTNPGSGTDLPY